MGDTGILKRKYTEEIPDSAKYKTPQASIPARRTQIKINPDGKTSFGQNEIIRIIIPPQGYFDPEFSYLSFNVELSCPQQYFMKALEIWDNKSNAFVYDETTASARATIRVGKGAANVVPLVRYQQELATTAAAPTSDSYLYEWVPTGQIYPVLPYSSHGFFTRVVLRTANNTPIEDIQDYDYLSAHLGSLLQSQGYADTMGSLLEGWGDINTRAKYGLACVKNLQYIRPEIGFSTAPMTGTQVAQPMYEMPYSTYNQQIPRRDVEGLSPEGINSIAYAETVRGMKFTCNLNLGIFQQSQNLPLLFSGGLILELYTAPFERCISFTSIFSRVDALDYPNLRDSDISGDGMIVDVTAMNCKLPSEMTTLFGWQQESASPAEQGKFLDYSFCGYALNFMRVDGATLTATEANRTSESGMEFYLDLNKDLRLTDAHVINATQYSADNVAFASGAAAQRLVGASLNMQANTPLLASRISQLTRGWSYTLTSVELRADMVQFSQSYDESVAEIVDSDEGLPITFQTFTVQKASYDGKRSTLTLNERARSIQFALAVFKDPTLERLTHQVLFDNDTRFVLADRLVPSSPTNADGTSVSTKLRAIANPFAIVARVIPLQGQEQALFPNLSDYQFRIGTRYIPSSPVDCTGGAVQAYIELMKAIGMYGSFSGTGQRANMPGNRITPDLYSKRLCTAASKVLAGAYYKINGSVQILRSVVVGDLESKDYTGLRYRIPQRFILGQNFSDIPDHASGVDTATQALSVELALNGKADTLDVQAGMSYNCYVFMNVRRDMFVRCGGQIEILY